MAPIFWQRAVLFENLPKEVSNPRQESGENHLCDHDLPLFSYSSLDVDVVVIAHRKQRWQRLLRRLSSAGRLGEASTECLIAQSTPKDATNERHLATTYR